MNIETVMIDYLADALDCSVSADIPKTRPGKFVTVERTGGNHDSVIIDRPTLAIQCWAKSRLEASELAYQVDDHLPGLLTKSGINRVERNSLYNFPDEAGNNARYQIVVNLVITN